MTCDVIQNRLLALPDLTRVPDDLRAHVDRCPGCRAFLAGAARLDGLLTGLPVPPSEDAKAAFLDRITAAGPIIRRVPTVPRFRSLRARVGGAVGWKPAAGLAAAVAVGAGIWLTVGGTSDEKPSVAAAPRHPLLEKQVRHVVALARANTPPDRMRVWAAVAADLRDETRAVYKVAPADEMAALARMFDKTVRQGIVPQADRLADHAIPAPDKRALLTDVEARLADVEAEASRLATQAPPQSVEPLKKIAAAARDGRLKLRGGA